jgi:hypothetical protein
MKCKEENALGQLWVAVRVERGFITQAEVYESKIAAKRKERVWRKKFNPDYDETAVIGASLIPHRTRNRRRAY